MKHAFARSSVRSLLAKNSAVEPLETRSLLTTLYVDPNATGATANAWDTAYLTLQAALGVAVSGDQILVADGTYYPGSLRTDSFLLKAGVTVKGGYEGYTGPSSATPGARSVTGYPTILSGDIGTSGVDSDNSYHVVKASSGGTTTVLDGFTITGGNADGTDTSNNVAPTPNTNTAYGGGIYMNLYSAAWPTITACTFTDNKAYLGGALYSNHSTPGFSPNFAIGCSFTNNSAVAGGAIYSNNSDFGIRNCTFDNNTATTGTGGAIFSKAFSIALVESCTFTNMTAYLDGGAIYSSVSALRVSNSLFRSCTATTGKGGAINVIQPWSSVVQEIKSCVFEDNSAGSNGGAIAVTNDTAVIDNSSFVTSSASARGGAVYTSNSDLAFTNCTFSANSANSSGYGGAIYASSSTVSVANSILWGDTGGGVSDEISDNGSSTLSVTYSDIEGGYTGTGNINSDPLFVEAPDPALVGHYGNLELRRGSPAVNAGDDTAIPSGVTKDIVGQQEGGDRIFGSHVDMGAYEQVKNTWVGGSGDWSDPSHWNLQPLSTSGTRIPNQYDVVDIPSGVIVQVDGGASTYLVGQLDSSSNLEIASGKTLKTFGDTVITGELELATTVSPVVTDASLDIQQYALTINFIADPEATMRGYLSDAYDGGTWNGAGLTSSKVQANAGHEWRIGYFNGNTDTVGGAAANQMIFKPLLAGDVDGDGTVGSADLAIIQDTSNYNHSPRNWAHGDLDYNNACDWDDFLVVAQQYYFTEDTNPLW